MPSPDPNDIAPLVLDALTLARQGGAYDGRFRQRRFTQLKGLLVSDQPLLDVSLRFDLKRGKPAVHGVVRGTVELVCQRCMGVMQYPLNEPFELLIVNEVAASAIEERDEIADASVSLDIDEWMADATRIDVIALIEEQVILALPLVAKHEDEQMCAAAPSMLIDSTIKPQVATRRRQRNDIAEADVETVTRPFANLRELLKK